MSIPKNRRKQSKIEFENIYFKVADDIDNFLENSFGAKKEVLMENRRFVESKTFSLEKLSDILIYHIKIANSIYPQCLEELHARRVAMDNAIGTCYTILNLYQRILHKLKIPDDKHTGEIQNVALLINTLKSWRKSDNRFKKLLEK